MIMIKRTEIMGLKLKRLERVVHRSGFRSREAEVVIDKILILIPPLIFIIIIIKVGNFVNKPPYIMHHHINVFNVFITRITQDERKHFELIRPSYFLPLTFTLPLPTREGFLCCWYYY